MSDETVEQWLALCGACDAGLPMSCTCPTGDYRTVLAEVVAQRDAARNIAAALQAQLARIEALANVYKARADYMSRRPRTPNAKRVSVNMLDGREASTWGSAEYELRRALDADA